MSATNPPEPLIHCWEVLALREKLGLTQYELGRLLRLSQQNSQQDVDYWESGGRPIPARCKRALRTMIDTADHLLARRKNPNWNL